MSIVVDYLDCECCDPPNCSGTYLASLPATLDLTVSGTSCSDGTYTMTRIDVAPPGWTPGWAIPAWIATPVPIDDGGGGCVASWVDVYLLCADGQMTIYVSGGGGCSPPDYYVPYAKTDAPFSVSQVYANCGFMYGSGDFDEDVTLVVTE